MSVQCSVFNLPFQIIIYHPIVSNNGKKMFLLQFYSCIVLKLFSKKTNHILHSFYYAQSIKCRLISEQSNRALSVTQEVSHIKITVVLIYWYVQCLHLIYSLITWVCISSHKRPYRLCFPALP